MTLQKQINENLKKLPKTEGFYWRPLKCGEIIEEADMVTILHRKMGVEYAPPYSDSIVKPFGGEERPEGFYFRKCLK